MRFLKKFCNWFKKSLNPNSISENHAFVTPDGSVGRFVFKLDRKFKDGKPKPAVFAPERSPETGKWETSVCGRNGVCDERFWYLGNTIITGKNTLAAVEITVAKVQLSGLRCEAAPNCVPIDYPEHGVIIGWDTGNEKSKRLAEQQELAANFKSVLWPEVSP